MVSLSPDPLPLTPLPGTLLTLYALKATEYAKRQGAFLPFHKGLYGAYWEDGLDLSDPEVIRTVAEAAGLDWSDMAKNLDAGSYEESVMGEFQEAVELGVRGIPAFLMGRYLFTGARPYEAFTDVMDKVIEERASASAG